MQIPPVDLKRHRSLRDVVRRHQNAAARKIPAPLFRKVARTLGLLRGDELHLESDGELAILIDHLLYDRRNRGKTSAERYLEGLPHSDNPDEHLARTAMAGHRYSLFEVVATHPPVGLVHRDLVRGGSLFVVDESMSRTIGVGALMAERVLPFPDYWVPSGSGFPISSEAAWEVEQTVVPALQASEDDLAELSTEGAEGLAAAIVALGFEEGTTGLVKYV